MKITITQSEAGFYRTVAERIAAQIIEKPTALIGLATGRTMVGVYAALREMHARQPFDTSQVTVYGLDEISGLPREYAGSCYARLLEQVVRPLGIREGNFLMPASQTQDFAAEAKRYEAKIARRGRVDLQILGIGENGHIGFNQPGTPFESRTWHSRMDAEREQRVRRESGTPENIPLGGLTLGIGTIMESRRIILAANGLHKAPIVAAALQGPVTTEVPASAVQQHASCEAILDPEAGELL